jgi:hypothetical protein
MDDLLFLVAIFFAGFGAGYGARAVISHHRRKMAVRYRGPY